MQFSKSGIINFRADSREIRKSRPWLLTTALIIAVLLLSRQSVCSGQEPQAAAPPVLQPGALSADRSDIGFIGLHGGVFEQLQSHAKPLQLKLHYFTDEDIANKTADLGLVQILYVQHTRAEDRHGYQALLDSAKSRNPELRIIAFQASSGEFLQTFAPGPLLLDDREAAAYYGSSSENLRRLLIYTAAKYLGRDARIEPPEDVNLEGLYHPDYAGTFPSAGAFQSWSRDRRTFVPEQPRILIAVHSTHLTFQQPEVVDALIREVEKQGAVAAAIIDGRSKNYEQLTADFEPHAVIHTCHSSDSVPFRQSLNVPHLHSIFIRKQSIAEWQQSLDGLSSSELAFHVIGQELIGGIEPQVNAGTSLGLGGAEALQPIPDRVEHLVRRALAYAKLAQTANDQKKVAVIYYDREMGKGELMRGSATGMHMNGPRSLINVLKAMQTHGYSIQPVPQFEDELLGWMIERGRQIGVWAPAELDRLVRDGSPALVSAKQYKAWYEARVPEDRRKQLEEKWGAPPGKFMVWNRDGEDFIVIPRVQLGNVILLPQPLRGELHGKEGASAQAHDKVTTPPHNYLATYFWLEEEFGANAVVHFGTHGSEFALPGKPNGLAQRDWCDILMGSLPNFNPWIIENMVESSPVRRRVYGTLIGHLPPPIVDAGLSDELSNLHELVDKWTIIEDGALKEEFRKQISHQIRQCRIDIDLKLTSTDAERFSAENIQKVADYLHDIQEETTPVSLHMFGERPREDLLIPYLVSILRSPFLKAVESVIESEPNPNQIAAALATHHDVHPAAEEILRLVLRQSFSPQEAVSAALGREISQVPEELQSGLRLAQQLDKDFGRTSDEVDNLLAGLDGRFVPPGPGNSPIRNPNAVPTGRNMYLLNPDEVPTRPSWELGRKLADELIARHQKQHDHFPTKIGFDLRSSATFRDYGVMEAQILHLMGIEPIWDERGLVHDVKLISRESLGRPRVDVFIAAGSWYESNLPGRLNLWDKAVRLAAQSGETDNPLFQNTQQLHTALLRQGIAEDRALLLAPARIFGLAPGRETGSFLAYSVARSGDWNTRADIATEYLASHKHVYTAGAWGDEAVPLYDAAIQGTHTVVRSWSDHMTGPLASRYTWLHGGSLSLAVETMTGKRPEYVFSDVRDPDKGEIINAEDALRREFRVRLFNRKWLEGMMKEGYAGADHIRVMTSNSFGWEVMRPGSVGDDNWNEMKQVLVDDKLNLHLREWMEQANPYAWQDATATMLEAIRKGYWRADDATRQQLAMEYARSVVRHGMSGHMTSGGNAELDRLVRNEVETSSSPDSKPLLEEYSIRISGQRTLSAIEQMLTSVAAPASNAVKPAEEPVATAAPANLPLQAATDSTPAAALPAESRSQAVSEASSPKGEVIEGQRLVQKEPSKDLTTGKSSSTAPPNGSGRSNYSLMAVIAIAAITLLLGGFAFRRGAP